MRVVHGIQVPEKRPTTVPQALYTIAAVQALLPRPFGAKIRYAQPNGYLSTAYTDDRWPDGRITGTNKHTNSPVTLRWSPTRETWYEIPSLCPTVNDTTCWDDRLRSPVHCEHDRCHACGLTRHLAGAPHS